MKNIIDYVREAKYKFQEKEFSVVDSLVLSQLSYLNFEDFVPSSLDTSYKISMKDIASCGKLDRLFLNVRDVSRNRKLLSVILESNRFKNLELLYYKSVIDTQSEMQFAAITFLLDDETAYIAYRGTDSTFVGWKEDFNMAFLYPIPAQEKGLSYLNDIASFLPNKLRVGGHSKGGNIAIYASMNSKKSICKRIIQIYNHDGPGFLKEIYNSKEFMGIKNGIRTTIPQTSVIGLMLQENSEYETVESNRLGIMQHDPFSWIIDNEDFSYCSNISKSANYLNQTIHQWVYSVDVYKREIFINTLYQVIQSTNVTSVNDFTGDWKNRAFNVLHSIKNLDIETRKFLFGTILALFVIAKDNINKINDVE
ncbi:Mbeg1-like protein [Fusibacter bizertensis]